MICTVHDFVTRLGLKRSGREWRGNCPLCGYGNGAFVVSAGRSGKPLAWCSSCQDRDALKRLIGGTCPPAPNSGDTSPQAVVKADKAVRALALWQSAVAAAGTPAELYLNRRGLLALLHSTALRFRPDTPHPACGNQPAMLAVVTNAQGTAIAVHRTYLTTDGRKGSVTPVKASLGPIWGGAIRLDAIEADKPLMIGEGVETAASAGCLVGLPAWAAVSAGNLATGLLLPPRVRRVIIAADPDKPGQRAASQAWHRWTAEGREVRIATPTGSGDFNDLLMAKGAEYAA